MDSQTYLQINNLNKLYDKHQALDNVSLNISVGEIVGLLGPNGAGKSTTMKIVTGNLSSSSGDVLINDINIIHQPTRTKTQLGYLPEVPPLYKELTVYEFLILASKLKKIPKWDILYLGNCGDFQYFCQDYYYPNKRTYGFFAIVLNKIQPAQPQGMNNKRELEEFTDIPIIQFVLIKNFVIY